jgi:hypothetical protein
VKENLNASGHSWDCGRGFSEVGRSFVTLTVPGNAHLDYVGNRWTCDPSDRTRGKSCAKDER